MHLALPGIELQTSQLRGSHVIHETTVHWLLHIKLIHVMMSSEDTRKRKHMELEVLKSKSKGLDCESQSSTKSSSAKETKQRPQLLSLNAYDKHKRLIKDYLLCYPGLTKQLKRDTSRDVQDIHVIQKYHQFLWTEEETPDTWERQLAKRYYDKLFREYGICDLSRYKENKIALRWRIEKEVIEGKGQFSCGEKHCQETDAMRTWEVNFAYLEQGQKKNALVKIRLCPDCSYKLNYHHKKKEVTKKPYKSRKVKKMKEATRSTWNEETEKGNSDETVDRTADDDNRDTKEMDAMENIWKEYGHVPEEKSREDEFAEYLEDLFM